MKFRHGIYTQKNRMIPNNNKFKHDNIQMVKYLSHTNQNHAEILTINKKI